MAGAPMSMSLPAQASEETQQGRSGTPPTDQPVVRPRTLRERWTGPRTTTVSRFLVLGACGLLFLNAAATIEVVYTLRLSYLLVAAACVVGWPYVLDGWRLLPRAWCVAAGALVAVYLLAAAVGDAETVATQERAGAVRGLVYVVNLLLGIATVGLVTGLFRDDVRPMIVALVAGAVLAALYGIVQWPARQFDWAVGNVNNALNPDAVTRGEVFQGTGLLLGWERVRGTFTEPLFFGLYLGTILPLIVTVRRRGRSGLAYSAVAGAAVGVALLLTSSFPSWSIFGVAGLVGIVVVSVGRGAVVNAGVGAGALALGAIAVTLVLVSPGLFAKVTGRGASDLTTTSATRIDAWERSTVEWAEQPLVGHGPGQSGVQLAYRQDPSVVGTTSAPVVLGSAQGLLPAALIDAGLLGALAWVALMVACIVPIVRGAFRRPDALRLGVLVAGLVAIGGAQVSGDRFETQTWLVIGLALTATVPGLKRAADTPRAS